MDTRSPFRPFVLLVYHSSPTSCRQPQHLTVTVSLFTDFTQTTTCRFLVLCDVNHVSPSFLDASQTDCAHTLSKVFRNVAPTVGTVGCSTEATARADGSMSAARLQQHCSHAQEDGLTHPMVQRLAGVGNAQNAHNGLMSLLETCASSMPCTNSTKCCTTNLCLFPTVGSIGCSRRASSWEQSTNGFESLLGSQTDVAARTSWLMNGASRDERVKTECVCVFLTTCGYSSLPLT